MAGGDVLRGDEQLKTIPVIMISVTDQSHLVGQVDNVVNALTKPLNRNSLLQAIESALHTTRV